MDELARTCEEIGRWNSRLRKVRILADYFRGLSEPDLAQSVRFLCCGPIQSDDRKFAVGGATLREALLQASGWDAQTLGACYAQVGDTGETVGLLMRAALAGDPAGEAVALAPMTLGDAALLYARLYKQRRTIDKVELLKQIYRQHRPETLKFFVKVITGNLRIGLQAKMVEEAIADATGAPLEEVRAANNRVGDLPRVAISARRGLLHEIEARLFHPMDFMLAKPLDSVEDLETPEDWWVEDKFDGFRSQIHAEAGRAVIFTRGMEDVSHAFPEITTSFAAVAVGGFVLDGEILAWREDRALPFAVLQQRIARKKMTEDWASTVPVVFVAYDVLYAGGRMTIGDPLEQRRRVLEQIAASLPIRIASQWSCSSREEVDRAFNDARERGNEGLVLKRKGSLYEPSKRSGAWMKMKRPHGTLDVVVTAAEQGSGRRAIFLSDYTFAVRDGDRYLNVGKAYSGLTDVEVRELTRILRGLTTERFGKVALVRPEVVLEVAFDGVQKSPRHKSGYALRFPRILAWRKDKGPCDADTLDRVKELYATSLSGAALGSDT